MNAWKSPSVNHLPQKYMDEMNTIFFRWERGTKHFPTDSSWALFCCATPAPISRFWFVCCWIYCFCVCITETENRRKRFRIGTVRACDKDRNRMKFTLTEKYKRPNKCWGFIQIWNCFEKLNKCWRFLKIFSKENFTKEKIHKKWINQFTTTST